MKKTALAITIATLYVIFFQAAPFIGIPDKIIIPMFILSPFVVIGMVYIVLKYGKPSPHTFNEKFYDDYDYKRISEKEN